MYYRSKYKRVLKAFGLAEIMVSIMIAGTILAGTVAVIVQAYVSIQASNQRVKAAAFNQEQLNSLVQYKSNNWKVIASNTGDQGSNPVALNFIPTANISGTTDVSTATTNITGTNTHFQTDLQVGDNISVSGADNTYVSVTQITSDTQITVSGAVTTGLGMTIKKLGAYKITNSKHTFTDLGTTYTTSFTIDKAYRSAGDSGCASTGTLDNINISSCTHYIDNHYRWLTFTTTWNDIAGKAQSASFQTYINDYDLKVISLDNFNDMRNGAQFNNTNVLDNSGDGSIVLTQTSPGNYGESSPFSSYSGTYISQIFDTGSNLTNFFSGDANYDISQNSALTGEVRYGNSISEVSSSNTWQQIIPGSCITVLPENYANDKSICDTFSVSAFQNHRYFQIRLTLTTYVQTFTPSIKSIFIYYQ